MLDRIAPCVSGSISAIWPTPVVWFGRDIVPEWSDGVRACIEGSGNTVILPGVNAIETLTVGVPWGMTPPGGVHPTKPTIQTTSSIVMLPMSICNTSFLDCLCIVSSFSCRFIHSIGCRFSSRMHSMRALVTLAPTTKAETMFVPPRHHARPHARPFHYCCHDRSVDELVRLAHWSTAIQ